MKQILSPMTVVAAGLLLLCSCAKPIPAGSYRVTVEESKSELKSLLRTYTIETMSLRKIVLAEPNGATSSSISPDNMTKDPTGKAVVTVTATLVEAGEQAHVQVNMIVETRGGTARSEEILAVPGVTDLSSILTETNPAGNLTDATTLLRLTFEEKYVQIVIE